MAKLEHLPMTKTELRLIELAYQDRGLSHEPNFNAALCASVVSSVDAFMENVGEAFETSIPAGEVAELKNMQDLAVYLDTCTG